MKKQLFYLFAVSLLGAGAVSCSDFLELDESEYHTVKYQFSTFNRVKQSATNVYGYVRDGLSDVEQTMLDAASDDAVYAWETGGIKRFYDGSWSPINLIDDRWRELYEAMRRPTIFWRTAPRTSPKPSIRTVTRRISSNCGTTPTRSARCGPTSTSNCSSATVRSSSATAPSRRRRSTNWNPSTMTRPRSGSSRSAKR